MTEREFLEHNVFQGIKNMNTGYDNDTIWHFSSQDFETVLARSEEFDIKILGIECWEKEEEKHTKFYEDYKELDRWHRQAYRELVETHSPCIFTATFDIPPIYLQDHMKD